MVIIIGATGFIGHYTTKYFREKGAKVLATGRNEKNSRNIKIKKCRKYHIIK